MEGDIVMTCENYDVLNPISGDSYTCDYGWATLRIEANQVEKVVVLYKDRLLRFGFELLETIATIHGCKIEIVDTTRKSEQQELVEDLVQIITVFSCKLQGKRAHQAKKMIQELAGDDSDDKVNPSTAVAEQ